MTEKLNYIVKADGWVAGQYRKKDEPIEMTEREAKYEPNLQRVVIGVDLATGPDKTVVTPVSGNKTTKRSRKTK